MPLQTTRGRPAGWAHASCSLFRSIFHRESLMNRQFGRRSFYPSVLCAFAALLFTSTFARAQYLYNQDWAGRFNNSVTTETEDNWVANSYKVPSTARQHLVSISLPIADASTNQPISAFFYHECDLNDPTAG